MNTKTTDHMLRQRLIRIETKVSRMMEHFSIPMEGELEVVSLSDAYNLIADFQEVINNTMDGDHPSSNGVEAWLTHYEKSRCI
jgi:hypothetical protein